MKTFLYRLTMKLIALLIVRLLSLACARENKTTNIPTIGPKPWLWQDPKIKGQFNQVRWWDLHL